MTEDSLAARVRGCFEIALPTLSPDQLSSAERTATPEWDSLASLTLITVLEEEFGVTIGDDVADSLTSLETTVHAMTALVNA